MPFKHACAFICLLSITLSALRSSFRCICINIDTNFKFKSVRSSTDWISILFDRHLESRVAKMPIGAPLHLKSRISINSKFSSSLQWIFSFNHQRTPYNDVLTSTIAPVHGSLPSIGTSPVHCCCLSVCGCCWSTDRKRKWHGRY